MQVPIRFGNMQGIDDHSYLGGYNELRIEYKAGSVESRCRKLHIREIDEEVE